jgi:hypothetical protein
MRDLWNLPWYRRFVYEFGRWSESEFGSWQEAVVVYGILGVVALYATLVFLPSLVAVVFFLACAAMSWDYGRHLKGRIR